MTRENKQFLRRAISQFFYQMYIGAGNLLLAGLILLVVAMLGFSILFDERDVNELLKMIFGG